MFYRDLCGDQRKVKNDKGWGGRGGEGGDDGDSSVVLHAALNHKVAGSNPTPSGGRNQS